MISSPSMLDLATVYAIDDDAGIRRSLERLLKPLALPILSFASAKAFLGGADATASGYLILDRRLEGMHSYTSPFRLGHYSMRSRTGLPNTTFAMTHL
jgi:FixJ family two-component response regulator